MSIIITTSLSVWELEDEDDAIYKTHKIDNFRD